MQKLSRRTILKLLSSVPLTAGVRLHRGRSAGGASPGAGGAQTARKTGAPFKPKFFTSHEYETVRMLVDLIIPRDERSGSATDAGVPEFMDFTMIDQPDRQTAMRGGLAWLDLECQQRFDKTFLDVHRGAADGHPRRHRRLRADDGRELARRRVLPQLPRSHVERLLDEQDGDRGPGLHWQHRRAGMDRLP